MTIREQQAGSADASVGGLVERLSARVRNKLASAGLALVLVQRVCAS